MATLAKSKIGITAVLAAIICLISFPSLTAAASTQPNYYQAPYNPFFNPTLPTADFSVYAYPYYSSVNAGSSVNTTITVTPLYGFAGAVSLSASAPAGWTATFVPDSVSLENTYYGFFYYSYARGNYSQLSVAVPHDAATGKYTVTVTGTSGELTHSVNVTVSVVAPDFRITVYPSHATVNAGTAWNSTVILSPLYQFNGDVSLSASVPTDWAASFNSSSLSLTATTYFNWTQLTVTVPSDAEAGQYTIVVTGAVGSVSRSANVTVTVVAPDFRMMAYPSRASVTAGTTWNSTVVFTSLYNFNDTVSLSASVPDGWAASFVPSSVSVANKYYYYYWVSNWSRLSLVVPPDAAAGTYTVVVTGTSGLLSHSVNVTVTVVTPDFQVTAFPSYLWVDAGSTVNSTVMVTPLYGFTDTVSLSASVPDGWTATFDSSSLSLTNGHYGYYYYYYGYYDYSTLSVAVPSDAAAGQYTVVVTGTSGSLVHSANVTVTVK